MDKFVCQNLESTVYQLGVLMYPPDLFNEQFLLNIRNCMLKLRDDHPMKRWLKSESDAVKPDSSEQKTIDLVTEMLNSPFNLITDQKVKSSVIELLGQVPEETNLEKLLKAYLYLMIGNITRSDNFLKSIIQRPPRLFYRGYSHSPSLYHRLTEQNLQKVLSKFSRHPADRTVFYLFMTYLNWYANSPVLLTMVKDLRPDSSERLMLNYTLRLAPELVEAARFRGMTDEEQLVKTRSGKLDQDFQANWIWPFIDLGDHVPEDSNLMLKKFETTDQLWMIYLLDSEKMAEQYFKAGGLSLSRRRQFLRDQLLRQGDFMMALFKLIELGDLGPETVQATLNFFLQDG